MALALPTYRASPHPAKIALLRQESPHPEVKKNRKTGLRAASPLMRKIYVRGKNVF